MCIEDCNRQWRGQRVSQECKAKRHSLSASHRTAKSGLSFRRSARLSSRNGVLLALRGGGSAGGSTCRVLGASRVVSQVCVSLRSPTSASAMHACNRQTKLFQAFARWLTRRIIGRLMVCADRQEFFASIDSLPKAFASG